MIIRNFRQRAMRLMRIRSLGALAALAAALAAFPAVQGHDLQDDKAGQEGHKPVLGLVDQASGPGRGLSPLNFEMPRIPPDAAAIDPPAPADGKDKGATNPATATGTDNLRMFASSAPGMLLMAGLTFLPAALLMTTSYVRIQITLGLLRQALGSPSIPGNQVIVALSLLLSVLVMKPVAERVYADAVVPYSAGRISQIEALRKGSEPIRRFMLAQIRHTGHEGYLEELAAYSKSQDSVPATPTSDADGNTAASGDDGDYPLHVVAPAFLLSELTTALSIGFAVYLPFLVVDLVVATVLAAMGIWMMPPTLIATPAKLILFVLADGWMLTAGALINGFAAS